MTRLGDALKRASEISNDPALLKNDQPVSNWQFPADDLQLSLQVPAEPPPPRRIVVESVAAPPPPTAKRSLFGRRASASNAAAHARGRALVLRVDKKERGKLVIGDYATPTLTEQFRHLAAVLHHAQSERGARSLMVTSALPSEGKTLTSINLALTMSESYHKRVLLIDADLRRPRLQEMFGLPDGPGLTDCLAEGLGGKLPVHQVSDNLWILSAGHATADPMSTLVSRAMKELIADARQAFDWVIVDTPPIAILPDANLLASMIDSALVVVNAAATPYPMVQRAAEAVGRSRILGVVLNRADESAVPDSYSYYAQRDAGGKAAPRRGWFRGSR